MLLGHGTSLDPDSAAAVYQHAAQLRARSLFIEVREAFWKQDPQVNDVVASIQSPRLFIVPLFMSEGFFSNQIIPQELGFPAPGAGDSRRVLRRGTQTLLFCDPVGTHERMTAVLLARAREVVEKFPFPRAPAPSETTLFVVGHGTPRNENSRKAVESQVDLVRQHKLYADAQSLFLEEEPRVPECYSLARTRCLVVVPFFASDGLHAREDIPVLLGETKERVRARLQRGQSPWRNPTERRGKLVWYASSVGTAPEVADVILERVKEAARSL